MSKRKNKMAEDRKQRQKERMAPLHYGQEIQREFDKAVRTQRFYHLRAKTAAKKAKK